METFNDEACLFNMYRRWPLAQICFSGRWLACFKIMILTKPMLLQPFWVNNSGKNDPPPDFYSNKLKTMMEFMRMDDCVEKIDGKHIANSFERIAKIQREVLNLKNDQSDLSFLLIDPDTSNPKEFNFKGYLDNFKRVVDKHSKHVGLYRKNHPQCKTTVFLIWDESGSYIQAQNEKDLQKYQQSGNLPASFFPHQQFHDSVFLNILKNCSADFVIWICPYKSLIVDGKFLRYPSACICDIRRLIVPNAEHNHELMIRVNAK